MSRIAMPVLSLWLLGGCVNTLGHSLERTAPLSRAPDGACVEQLLARIAGQSSVTRQHKDDVNFIDGKVQKSTNRFTIHLAGLDEFAAIQAGASFSVSVTSNVRPVERWMSGAGGYRLFWYYSALNVRLEAEIHRMALRIEEGMVAECGASFAKPVQERKGTDRELSFNVI